MQLIYILLCVLDALRQCNNSCGLLNCTRQIHYERALLFMCCL